MMISFLSLADFNADIIMLAAVVAARFLGGKLALKY
jgi:hypothetical protein